MRTVHLAAVKIVDENKCILRTSATAIPDIWTEQQLESWVIRAQSDFADGLDKDFIDFDRIETDLTT